MSDVGMNRIVTASERGQGKPEQGQARLEGEVAPVNREEDGEWLADADASRLPLNATRQMPAHDRHEGWLAAG